MTTAMRPEEITNIIKDRIANFDTRLKVEEIGTVLSIGDGVARVFGLKNVQAGELVEFALGTLDSEITERPDVHIYTDFKANWFEVEDGLPCYSEGRDSKLTQK